MNANSSKRFVNRSDAGRQLAVALHHLASAHPVILALPRGGVPVAFAIAQALDAQLDLLFVRKLGAPGNEELGIGAVVDGNDPQLVLNEDVMRYLAPGPDYIQAEMRRQLREIERRRTHYMRGRQPTNLAGRTVILVDDGIATGGTVRAALTGLAKVHPAHLVLAIPVAPRQSVEQLAGECDEIICLKQPEQLIAVGTHYRDFDQTSDEEVIRLMDESLAFGDRQFIARG